MRGWQAHASVDLLSCCDTPTVPWFRWFLLPEPLANSGPLVLTPQEARAVLNERLAWEQQRLGRQCALAFLVLVVGATLAFVTGWLALLAAGLVGAVAVLALEWRRWRPARRQPSERAVGGLLAWLKQQQDPQQALEALQGSEGPDGWREVVAAAVQRWRNPG